MNHHSGSSAKRKPATARGAKTRAKILRAAETVFAEKGYEHGSIAEVAKEAQVALGTFYIYFPDKKSAFTELVDELGRKLRESLREATAELEDRLEIERVGLRTFLGFTTEHRGLYRIVRQAEFVDQFVANFLERAAEAIALEDLQDLVLPDQLFVARHGLGLCGERNLARHSVRKACCGERGV